jgi:hypothetical protein
LLEAEPLPAASGHEDRPDAHEPGARPGMRAELFRVWPRECFLKPVSSTSNTKGSNGAAAPATCRA